MKTIFNGDGDNDDDDDGDGVGDRYILFYIHIHIISSDIYSKHLQINFTFFCNKQIGH